MKEAKMCGVILQRGCSSMDYLSNIIIIVWVMIMIKDRMIKS